MTDEQIKQLRKMLDDGACVCWFENTIDNQVIEITNRYDEDGPCGVFFTGKYIHLPDTDTDDLRVVLPAFPTNESQDDESARAINK